jgi:shikimate kinase
MGSGKTTLGKAFARACDYSFVDLDEYTERRANQSLSSLFVERGEEAFRFLEHSMLREVIESSYVVIATGGGTPCFFDNMELMNRAGTTVFLDVPIERILLRLRLYPNERPMVVGKTDEALSAFVRDRLNERLPYYRQAQLVFAADRLENEEQINQSVQQLRALIKNATDSRRSHPLF